MYVHTVHRLTDALRVSLETELAKEVMKGLATSSLIGAGSRKMALACKPDKAKV